MKIRKPHLLPFVAVMMSMFTASCSASVTGTTPASNISNTSTAYHLSDHTPVIPNDFRQKTHSYREGVNSDSIATQIVNLIRSQFYSTAPTSGNTRLSITVDKNGRVINIASLGEDTIFSREAVRAVKSVGRFPIDSNDPRYPTFTVILRGSN